MSATYFHYNSDLPHAQGEEKRAIFHGCCHLFADCCCRRELVVLVDNIVRESLLLSVYANTFEKFAAAAVVLGNR